MKLCKNDTKRLRTCQRLDIRWREHKRGVSTLPQRRLRPRLPELIAALEQAQLHFNEFCGLASLGYFLPSAKRLPGFLTIHKENYEVAYHLGTAIGSARLMAHGATDEGLAAYLVHCQVAVHRHLRTIQAAYRRLWAAAPHDLRPWADALGGHLDATRGWARRAYGLTEAALGRELRRELYQKAERAAAY